MKKRSAIIQKENEEEMRKKRDGETFGEKID